MKTSNEFVNSVMTALPERESLLQRAGHAVLRLVLSPIWMWLCLLVVIVVFHQPILSILSVLDEISLTGIAIAGVCTASLVTFISVQMVRACYENPTK